MRFPITFIAILFLTNILAKVSYSDDLANLRNALVLTRSLVPAEKSFGWSAMQASIRHMTSDDREIPNELADQIENQVFEAVSADSLNTLKFFYANATLRRDRILNGDFDLGELEIYLLNRDLIAFVSAGLSYKFQLERTGGRGEINPVNLLAKLAQSAVLNTREIDQVIQILTNRNLSRTRFLVSLLASRLAHIELTATLENTMVRNIADCVATGILDSPIDLLIQQTCREVLTSLNQVFVTRNGEGQRSISQERLRELALSLYINSTESPENVKQTSLFSRQVPTAFSSQNTIKTSVAGRGAFSTLAAVVGDPNMARQMGIDPGTPCENGSDWKRGMIYRPANINRISGSTDGVTCTQIGVEHKTWGISGNPLTEGIITSAFSLEKQEQVSWVALRGVKRGIYIRPNSGNISCDAFVGPSQPGTEWTILQPVLGRKVGIRNTSSAEVHITDSSSVFKGGIFTAPFKFAGAEVFQFNEEAVARLNPSETLLLNLTERSPKNGLLKYVAAVMEALKERRSHNSSRPAWLLPDNSESGIEDSALQSLVRLDILSELGKMDFSAQAAAFPTNAPWYPEAPWKERQQFLRFSLPMMAYKIQLFYQEKLERQLVLIGRPLLALDRARQRLSTATRALDVLTDDDAIATLGFSADLLHVERPALPLARDLLITAVVGAHEAIRNEWIALAVKMTNTCVAHYLMQADFSQVLGAGAVKGIANPVFLPECQDFFRDSQANRF